ncbi:MAG: hypothetical protein Edafosvirus1_152, partial [Edafosvirus sp.]
MFKKNLINQNDVRLHNFIKFVFDQKLDKDHEYNILE